MRLSCEIGVRLDVKSWADVEQHGLGRFEGMSEREGLPDMNDTCGI